MVVSLRASTTQAIWEIARVAMNPSATLRRLGSWRAARAHWKIIGTRMIT